MEEANLRRAGPLGVARWRCLRAFLCAGGRPANSATQRRLCKRVDTGLEPAFICWLQSFPRACMALGGLSRPRSLVMNCGTWSLRSAGAPGGTGQDDRSAGEQG